MGKVLWSALETVVERAFLSGFVLNDWSRVEARESLYGFVLDDSERVSVCQA